MIDGNTVNILRKQVPNYHLLSEAVATRSTTICACRNCKHNCANLDGTAAHHLCSRVLGKVEDAGIAIVAANGTCDRAEWIDTESNTLNLANN